jgi:uncharacterized protein YecE (DUF72 family)
MNARIWLGAMSWQEKDWVGPFYPDGTAPKAMLAQYGRSLRTVEVDATYYGRPRATTIEEWGRAVPPEFRFALKVPSEVTHKRRFRDATEPFTLFVQRVRGLGPKLGALLLQCPPDFAPTAGNRERLFQFLETQVPGDVNVALELRDPRWFDDALFALAREKNVAIAATESERFDVASAADILERQKGGARFAYLRFMSDEQFEAFDRVRIDRSQSLAAWVDIIRGLRERVDDIYGYVSDDYAGHAPATVRTLLEMLGETAPADITTLRLF